MKLLYVEDNPRDADLTQRALTEAKIDPDLAASVSEALQRLAVGHYDLVLVDLTLPDGSGMEVLAHIRERDLPVAVVILTGSGDQESAVAALKAGADDYVTKYDNYLERLPSLLRATLDRRRDSDGRRRRPLRVLYAEHHAFDIDLTQRHLALHAPHIRLTAVGDAAAVLERLHGPDARPDDWDVLLLDYNLPGTDALELTKLLRYQYGLDLPVVVITGQGTEEVAAQAMRLGVADYLIKHPGYLHELPAVLEKVQRQAELLASEARLRLQGAALEAAANAIVITDRDAVIQWANPAFSVLTGFDPEEVLGRKPQELLRSGVQGEQFYAALWQTILDGRVWRGELVNRRKDGSLYHEDMTITPVRKADGGIGHFVAVKQDISERVRARQVEAELERRFRATFEQAAVGIAHVAPDGHWLRVNQRLCDILGYSREELLGLTFQDITHPDDLYRDLELVGKALAGEISNFTVEKRYLRKDGGTVWINLTVALVRQASGVPDYFISVIEDISARKRVEAELRQREQALEMAAAVALDLLRESDPDAAIRRVLERLGRETGVDRVYIFANRTDPVSGLTLASQRHEWAREGVSAEIDNPQLQDFPFEARFGRWHAALSEGRTFKGRVRDFPDSERAVLEPQGIVSLLVVPIFLNERLWGFLGFDSVHVERDWSASEESVLRIVAASLGAAIQRKQTVDALRQAATVFESTREGVIITDLQPRILAVNPAYTEITGYSEAEVLGQNPRLLQSGRQDKAFYQAMWASLLESGHWQGEIWNRRKNGELYPQLLTLSTVRDERGRPKHYVGAFTDIGMLKQSEARLEHLAHFDPLTDLPNRLLVQSRLGHAMERAGRQSRRVAVLFIDLDRFKTINDSLGHPVGDELLAALAERMRERLRDEDTLARLGGDEFLVLLEDLQRPEDAAGVAQVLIRLLEQPFSLPSGYNVYAGASIGISLYPDDGEDVTELIKHADVAMYQAKEQGRNTYRFYTPALTWAANERLDLEARLRRALARGEFVLHYQPQLDMHTDRLLGCEALVRWLDPVEGMVSPGRFIPLAEETGLIVPLGEWVLRTACEQARAWLDAGLPPLVMAVNLSGRQLQQRDLVQRVAAILAETGLPPERLKLELTESMIMGRGEQTVDLLHALKALGVRLSIDDFGTGYSSLAYLKRFPIDELKIDQGFVRDIPQDTSDMEIAATIIAMSHNLNLKVLAEGVETREQLGFLSRQGCNAYQGYLYSRPVPAEEFARFFTRGPEDS